MKKSILYLDDEPACLRVFEDAFGDDYDVRTAVSLGQARRLLAERPADIVISDQRMPEITGVQFLQEVAEQYPASRRVILSGSISVGEVIREVGAGLVHLFVAKPWTLDQMQETLERAGTIWQLRGEAFASAPLQLGAW